MTDTSPYVDALYTIFSGSGMETPGGSRSMWEMYLYGSSRLPLGYYVRTIPHFEVVLHSKLRGCRRPNDHTHPAHDMARDMLPGRRCAGRRGGQGPPAVAPCDFRSIFKTANQTCCYTSELRVHLCSLRCILWRLLREPAQYAVPTLSPPSSPVCLRPMLPMDPAQHLTLVPWPCLASDI
nr:hypothetical protein CFP56_28815 [Quercus suber]POE53598.1 hypothetical protein CFP56_28820 [Quercus suber]